MSVRAVATKELRSRMRGARAFAVLTVYLLLLTGLVLVVYWFTSRVIAEAQQFGGGPPPPVGKILF